MNAQPALITVTTAVESGVVVFILGQIFQQYILEPVREFRRQRADAIYFAIHFIEFVNHDTDWNDEDRQTVKQMRAALIISAQLVPSFRGLSKFKIFGLPNFENVEKAATSIASIGKLVDSRPRKGEPSSLKLARDIGEMLGVKISV
ncbi:MAG: hypothetical protein K9G60_16255 [Pseudolabrys sp.]|nr:hypothetical protein [Pseudolabrys sp.]